MILRNDNACTCTIYYNSNDKRTVASGSSVTFSNLTEGTTYTIHCEATNYPSADNLAVTAKYRLLAPIANYYGAEMLTIYNPNTITVTATCSSQSITLSRGASDSFTGLQACLNHLVEFTTTDASYEPRATAGF